MKRWFIRLVVLVVIIAAVTAGFRYWRDSNRPKPLFQTATVARGEIIQSVTATGQLEPVVNVQVGSQISGRISEISVDYNSLVKKGQLLARIDPVTYEARVSQAKGQLASAKAQLHLAQVNAERTRDLHAKDLVSQSDLDQATATLEQAEANVQIQVSNLDSAQADLDRCTILAPINGIVISRNIDVGQTVAASLSAPVLFTIANDLTQMQIEANVAEADIGNVKSGQEVRFTVDAYPGRSFQGEVTQVRNSPQTVDGVVTYTTIIGVRNEDQRLKPGMTANVSIILARRENALRIPNAALRLRIPETLNVKMNKLPPRQSGEKGRTPALANGNGERRTFSRNGANGGSLSPEARAEAPRRWRAQHGESGSAPAAQRTVYTLALKSGPPELDPLEIRTGISDGSFTEVLSGLAEGQKIVSGVIVQGTADPFGQRGGSPFTGGGRFRRF